MQHCDIIIPVWNQRKYTRDCIESIFSNTKYPYKIILVDNASSSETVEYLEGLRGDKRLTLIRNSKNLGFIKAVNKGISSSDGGFVCILNNDTIVTPGWLEEMIKVMRKDTAIGIVNPSSNTLGQKLEENETPIEHAKRSRYQTGQYVELGNAFGFCMLIKRELFKKIGLFDESYGMGYFEDTDFSLRAKEKGYKTVRAFSPYVYHIESGSFNLLKSFNKDFRKNKRLFESKWGKTERVAVVFENINSKSMNRLGDILKEHAKENSWVYVIAPIAETRQFFEKHSNITFYNFKSFFYMKAFFKILFKKKKPCVIYSEKRIFPRALKLLLPKLTIRNM